MRQTLGTDFQKHGAIKDAQKVFRHASIKTTADVYVQEILASVRAANQLPDVRNFGETSTSFAKTSNYNVPQGPNWKKRAGQVLQRNGSSGRTRIHFQT
jgi:hypothetical protein